MIHSLLILFSLIIISFQGVHGQDAAVEVPVRIRAVLHDPVRPTANLYYRDKADILQPLEFRPQDLTRTLIMLSVDGSLVLYDKPVIDPEKPGDGVAATVRLNSDMRRAMVVVLPSPPDSKMPYRMLAIDDSEKEFPFGESKVLSLIGSEIGVQAGEHKVRVEPGKQTSVPKVKKVNDFSMAQTNFHYQQEDGAWVAFAERQLQFLDVCRRLFIVHATPGALQPTVTTIVDTKLDRREPEED